jgi:hypothetical protein
MNKRKQIFKGKVLLKGTLVKRIINIYNKGDFETNPNWYLEASIFAQELADTHQINYFKVCGIIAALSPLKNWDENKRIAINFILTGRASHTRLMTQKARTILTSLEDDNLDDTILATLNGNKIKNFFINIAYPAHESAVTIDRHALSICLNRSIKKQDYVGITNLQYNFFAEAYIEASEILNVLPCMVQAVTWEKWRELKK